MGAAQLHLQGDLQAVFDALYDMGVIEPVLEMDWRSRLLEMEKGSPQLRQAIIAVNECGFGGAVLGIEEGVVLLAHGNSPDKIKKSRREWPAPYGSFSNLF